MMTPHDKAALIQLIEKIPTTTRCIDCVNFNGGRCSMANAQIPAEVLEKGCEMWEFDSSRPPF